ncbi:hypothetical protein Q5P01_010046 [Channa striata]|uniref:B box-type domain-containing protein n=1 Tax=Channa striata TaxID=64152 RepID=A0AA88SY08_CHASR|nr:hypothetical protein Q5P01_010046 [Channa striata]
MNLNDFVVLPNNKAKSEKLNARNLQELQMETVTLDLESKDMEEKLQQLKENMSKEKEERGSVYFYLLSHNTAFSAISYHKIDSYLSQKIHGRCSHVKSCDNLHSGALSWKFGQCGPLKSNAITNGTKNNQKNVLQKLSAGRVKVRVLKRDPVTASSLPLPPPLASTTSLQTVRKNRLTGTICGQCEVKTAGLMCPECTENYCIGCFARFHQKGALKLHRMIPIQTDLHTHVSTPDVVNCFQKQIDQSLVPGTFTNLVPGPKFKSHCNPHHTFTSSTSPRKGDQSPEDGPRMSQAMSFHPDPSQVLVMNLDGEKKEKLQDEELKRKNDEDFPMSPLRGQYSEEESARSFQEALKQWRRETSDPTGEPTYEGGVWKPIEPVSVSAMATQVDLHSDSEAGEGRTSGGRVGRIPVIVNFMENSLTYMDRLLLKEHRRTPLELYHTSLVFTKDLKSPANTSTEEEPTNSLTAQEEDFRQYCASLFAVPVSRGRTEPQITTPESCLIIQVLDETNSDTNGIFAAVQREDNNPKVSSVQGVSTKGRTLVPKASITSGGSSSISHSSCISTQLSRHSSIAAQTKAAQRLNPFRPQTSQAEHLLTSTRLMPSKSKPPACPTVETPRTSKTSIKTQASKSQKPSLLNNIQIPTSAVKTDDVPSIDSTDEISSDSLGLSPHEEDSSDEEAQMHRRTMRGRSRGEEQGNPAISHLGDSFVPADAEQEDDLQTDETVQLPETSMVLHSQSAGSGLELLCDLHGFMPPGLDVNSVPSDTPEHTQCDPLHTGQTSSSHSDPLVSKADGLRSSFGVYPEEHLVLKMMDGVSHSATHVAGVELSANEVRTSGSNWSGKSTPHLSHSTMTTSSLIPASAQSSPSLSPSPPFCLSHPTLGSDMGPALRPLSRAAQEIMEICSVDQTGCEDPDLDSETCEHTIHTLEQELRLMTQEIGSSVFSIGKSGNQDQPGSPILTRSRVDGKQKEEEETTQRDRQSVLLLP